jgi:uncharacterized protein DUF6894
LKLWSAFGFGTISLKSRVLSQFPERTSPPGIDRSGEKTVPIFHFEIADGVRLEDPVGLDCKNEREAKETADLIARQIATDLQSDSEDRAVLVIDETGLEIYKAPVRL